MLLKRLKVCLFKLISKMKRINKYIWLEDIYAYKMKIDSHFILKVQQIHGPSGLRALERASIITECL